MRFGWRFLIFLCCCSVIGISPSFALTLRWKPADKNVDGSPLTDASHQILYIWSSQEDLESGQIIRLPPSTTSFPIPRKKAPGTYRAVIVAYDFNGNRSPYSNRIDFTIEAPSTSTPTATPTPMTPPDRIPHTPTPATTVSPTPTQIVSPLPTIASRCIQTHNDINNDGESDIIGRLSRRSTLSIIHMHNGIAETTPEHVVPVDTKQVAIRTGLKDGRCRSSLISARYSQDTGLIEWEEVDLNTGMRIGLGSGGARNDIPIFGCFSDSPITFIHRERDTTSLYTNDLGTTRSWRLPSGVRQLACGSDDQGRGRLFALRQIKGRVELVVKPLYGGSSSHNLPLPRHIKNTKLIIAPTKTLGEKMPIVFYTRGNDSFYALLDGRKLRSFGLPATLSATSQITAGITRDKKRWLLITQKGRKEARLIWLRTSTRIKTRSSSRLPFDSFIDGTVSLRASLNFRRKLGGNK